MPIPIRRLPLLVLDEVIKNLSFPQLFTLSLCSKRMNLVVKNLRTKSIKLIMNLTVGKEINICLNGNCIPYKWNAFFSVSVQARSEEHQEGWRAEKIGGILFEEDTNNMRIHLYDVEGGARYILDYVSDVFCAPINNVRLRDIRYLWVLDWIEKRQGPRSYYASIDDPNGLNDEQYRHLLFVSKPTNLQVSTTYETFQAFNAKNNYQIITFCEGAWMSIENLLTMNCTQLDVRNPTFTVAEINRFLRHLLIHNGAPRLINFRVLLKYTHESKRILDGVREVLIPIDGKGQFQENGGSWNFSGMLKRGNGSATVSIKCFQIGQPYINFDIIEA